MVAALFTVSSDMRRLKKCVFSFLRNTDSADETKTAIVVVFIPPAVEPGEPPASISNIIKAFDLSH